MESPVVVRGTDDPGRMLTFPQELLSSPEDTVSVVVDSLFLGLQPKRNASSAVVVVGRLLAYGEVFPDESHADDGLGIVLQ